MLELVIAPREKNLGDGFIVRRSLPFSKKKMVGPFIFFDHMGPVPITREHGLVVRGHPHIGLATLTYLFEGEIMHRDSLGNEQLIRPFEVNWMTAGRGIAHSERSVRTLGQNNRLEGLQVWIALPKEIEDIEPNFSHFTSNQIPKVQIGRNQFNLLAGQFKGARSPVPVYSRLFYLEGEMRAQDDFFCDLSPEEEGGVYVARGEINIGQNVYGEGSLLCFYQGTSVAFQCSKDARVLIIGGETFPEKRFVWWNFVSSSEAKIEIAKMRWSNFEFDLIINEDEYIPLPKEKNTPKDEAVIYP